jgi:checkpoint serine/threonine-protein kinase
LYDADNEFCIEEVRARIYPAKISLICHDIRKRDRPPSPTINTKAALQDVMEMFNQPLRSSTYVISDDQIPNNDCVQKGNILEHPQHCIESEEITRPIFSQNAENFAIFSDKQEPIEQCVQSEEITRPLYKPQETSFAIFADQGSFADENSPHNRQEGKELDPKNTNVSKLNDISITPISERFHTVSKEGETFSDTDIPSHRLNYFERNLVDILTPLSEISEPPSTVSSKTRYESIHVQSQVESLASDLSTFSPFDIIDKKNELDKHPIQFMDKTWQDNVREVIFSALQKYTHFHDRRDIYSGQKDIIEKASLVVKSKRYSSGTGYGWKYKFDGVTYGLIKKIGQGGYASVFLVDRIESTSKMAESGTSFALKIQKPGDEWEFYILEEVQRRLRQMRSVFDPSQSLSQRSFLFPSFFQLAKDEGLMLLPYCDQSTLLEIVNCYSMKNSTMEEIAVMFYSARVLALVETLHLIGITHGDVKPDNLMLRYDDSEKIECDPVFRQDGSGSWVNKGLTLLDFGRALDLELFPTGTQFLADTAAAPLKRRKSYRDDDFEDVLDLVQGTVNEQQRPWSFQLDYYGICNVIYCMLHGRYLEVCKKSGPTDERTLYPKLPFKRYWQESIWSRIFDALLNSHLHLKANTPQASAALLQSLRVDLEEYLEQNCNKSGKNLKAILHKHEFFKYYKSL